MEVMKWFSFGKKRKEIKKEKFPEYKKASPLQKTISGSPRSRMLQQIDDEGTKILKKKKGE